MNGYEKLKAMMKSGCETPGSDVILAMTDKIMSEPKFVMTQIVEIYKVFVPNYIEPIIRQGISDGSIKTDYPKELAEVIITLMNIWVNPSFTKSTPEELRRKIAFLGMVLEGIGIDIIDEETISKYVEYGRRYNS